MKSAWREEKEGEEKVFFQEEKQCYILAEIILADAEISYHP